MRQLLVLRHAKSSWKDESLDDHDRPLNARGRRDAPRMGAWIRGQGLVPECIVSSTAVRARTTAATVAEVCGCASPILDADVYLRGPAAYVAAAGKHGGDAARVLVVGHNPDVEELVLALTGVAETMPTAALAQIELAIERWSELTLRSPGRLVALWRPKQLPDRS